MYLVIACAEGPIVPESGKYFFSISALKKMRCWKDAGGAHPQARISGRDSSESSSYSVKHILPHQLLPLRLPLQDKVTSARFRRTFRCFSWSCILSLLPTTLLAAGSGKRVARVSGLLEIADTREQKGRQEPLLAEVMKKGGEGSAKKMYSVSQADYQLLEEVGLGGTATVYRALYIPGNEIVAVKCLDLHRSNNNLDDLRREAQMMCLVDHPNVVKGYCSFVVEHSLWEVMPFMAEGSCLHLMKIAYPEGFEEHVIGSLLKETLKAIEYLHRHGHIHRDVKAGNILLDSSGAVKLADFGATAYMFDKGDMLRSRNSFVGTPCWMAPEVLQPGGGYDFKADIWSFGITALELAHGHAPFSKYPPMKVLLMILQSSPPGLDYDRDKKFSKSFKEIVAKCLVKDPTKRPTAEELLKHSFFKNAKPFELYVKSLLSDLPPLWDRVKTLKLKDAAQLALKKMPSSNQEALSQRGVSAWNFDIEDLKAQASLIQDDDEHFVAKKDDGKFSHFIKDKEPSILRPKTGNPSIIDETTYRTGGDSQLPNEIPRHGARNSPYSNSLSAPIQSLGCGYSPEDNGSANVVQRKGRFTVTSENVDLLQVKTGATEREHLVEILRLQTRMVILSNELTAQRLKCTELQQKLSALESQEHQREEPEQKGLIYASIESKVYMSSKQP